MKRHHRRLFALATGLGLGLMPGLALAHHPMGGVTPETAWQGLLSGVGHPIIGPDHFAFIIGLGLLAGRMALRSGALAILAFLAGGFVGSLIHLQAVDVPAEPLIAGSVLILGAAIWMGRAVALAALLPALALAGALHGYAFAESIIGAETSPLVAYLLGLAVTQGAIAAAVALVTAGRAHLPVGAVGALIAGVGLTLLHGHVL